MKILVYILQGLQNWIQLDKKFIIRLCMCGNTVQLSAFTNYDQHHPPFKAPKEEACLKLSCFANLALI